MHFARTPFRSRSTAAAADAVIAALAPTIACNRDSTGTGAGGDKPAIGVDLPGILHNGHYGSVSATQGNGWVFQVFAATVIGGVSLNGGKGSVVGALPLQLVVNVTTLAWVPPLCNQFLNRAITIVASGGKRK